MQKIDYPSFHIDGLDQKDKVAHCVCRRNDRVDWQYGVRCVGGRWFPTALGCCALLIPFYNHRLWSRSGCGIHHYWLGKVIWERDCLCGKIRGQWSDNNIHSLMTKQRLREGYQLGDYV